MMHKLEFLNPVGLISDNFSTVRLGTKWAECTADEDRRGVSLVDASGTSFGTACVLDCWSGPLHALPAMLVENSHDPITRTWSGVAQVLAAIYVDEEVGYETIVTVLRLKHTGSLIKI